MAFADATVSFYPSEIGRCQRRRDDWKSTGDRRRTSRILTRRISLPVEYNRPQLNLEFRT